MQKIFHRICVDKIEESKDGSDTEVVEVTIAFDNTKVVVNKIIKVTRYEFSHFFFISATPKLAHTNYETLWTPRTSNSLLFAFIRLPTTQRGRSLARERINYFIFDK